LRTEALREAKQATGISINKKALPIAIPPISRTTIELPLRPMLGCIERLRTITRDSFEHAIILAATWTTTAWVLARR